MTHDPHTGAHIYDGDPTVAWLAICHDGCGAREFDCPDERDAWMGGHEAHDVSKALEVRE